jgi:hypothetical protein
MDQHDIMHRKSPTLLDTILFIVLFFATFTTLFPLQYIINQMTKRPKLALQHAEDYENVSLLISTSFGF